MAIEHTIICDKNRLVDWMREQFGIDASGIDLKKTPPPGGSHNRDFACSASAIIWALNRARECGALPRPGCPEDADEITFLSMGDRGDGMLDVAPVSRSRITKTLTKIYPIDLIAMRVTTWCDF